MTSLLTGQRLLQSKQKRFRNIVFSKLAVCVCLCVCTLPSVAYWARVQAAPNWHVRPGLTWPAQHSAGLISLSLWSVSSLEISDLRAEIKAGITTHHTIDHSIDLGRTRQPCGVQILTSLAHNFQSNEAEWSQWYAAKKTFITIHCGMKGISGRKKGVEITDIEYLNELNW